MSYKCSICGANDVDVPGGICELCAISQDPYASSGSSAQVHSSNHLANTNNPTTNNQYIPKHNANRKILVNGNPNTQIRDPYGNDITPHNPQPKVQVYASGQSPQITTTVTSSSTTSIKTSTQGPITFGITKNIILDNQKKSILAKWIRSLVKSIPFTLDNDVTMFQVFPDFAGTSLNALGNACDQVIFYGKLNQGAISENNDIEVYGRRDSNNNIIAQYVRNKATGTTIYPMRTIGVGAVWAVTLIAVLLIVSFIAMLGVEGILWTVILILCLTNMSKVFKVISVLFGMFFSCLRRIFR